MQNSPKSFIKNLPLKKKRCALGLNRWGENRQSRIKDQIDPEWLAKALTEDGLTLADVGKKYGVTRERMRQIGNSLGIRNEKTPLWYAKRLGDPRLADKEWIENQLQDAGLKSFFTRFKVSESNLRKQMKRLEIDLQAFYRHAPKVTVKCTYCGKIQERKLSVAKLNKKEHFCDRKCLADWQAKNNGGTGYREWTEEENELIRVNYKKMSDAKLGKLLN